MLFRPRFKKTLLFFFFIFNQRLLINSAPRRNRVQGGSVNSGGRRSGKKFESFGKKRKVLARFALFFAVFSEVVRSFHYAFHVFNGCVYLNEDFCLVFSSKDSPRTLRQGFRGTPWHHICTTYSRGYLKNNAQYVFARSSMMQSF